MVCHLNSRRCDYVFKDMENSMLLLVKLIIRDAFKKKIAEKETLVHMGGRGGKINPLFLAHQKGDIFLWGEGSNFFVPCPMFIFVFLSPHNL